MIPLVRSTLGSLCAGLCLRTLGSISRAVVIASGSRHSKQTQHTCQPLVSQLTVLLHQLA